MIKNVFQVLLIILLFILQITLLNKFSFFNAVPNLILIVSICLVLKQNLDLSIFIAGVGGLLLDLVSPIYFGFYTITYLLIILILNYFILKISQSPNRFIIYLIFVIVSIFIDSSLLVFTKILPNWHLLLSGLINGIFGITIYLLIEKISPQEEEINII